MFGELDVLVIAGADGDEEGMLVSSFYFEVNVFCPHVFYLELFAHFVDCGVVTSYLCSVVLDEPFVVRSSFCDFDSGVYERGSEELCAHTTYSSVEEKVRFSSSGAVASYFCEFSVGVKGFTWFEEEVIDTLHG